MLTEAMKLLSPPCVALLFTGLLAAQIPGTDSRNTYTPGTETHFSAPRFSSVADWEMRRDKLQKQILAAAGLDPLFDRTPLNPQVFGKIERQGYTIEKVLLETLPGYYLGGNLYRPTATAGRHPGIVSPHGHWAYGRLENSAVASVPERCINLARLGFVVFSYDMVGYNDTLQTPHDFGGPEEALWSFSPLALQLWNSLRAVDFLSSLPDVDPQRIAATGASGGATQTLLLQAIDPRIRWSAPVNMISFIMQGGGECENAPGLRLGTSNVEIAALAAPRPMIMVSDTTDWTRNTPREEFPAVHAIYELYGAGDAVETVQFEAQHNYNKESREAVYRFFARRILADPNAASITEKPSPVPMPNQLLALHARTLPPGALDYAGLFELWKNMSRHQRQAQDPAQLRASLQASIGVEWPAHVGKDGEGKKVALGREGFGDRVPAIWIPGPQSGVAVIVHPGGAEAARRDPEVERILKTGWPALLIDAFQTGSAVAPRDRSGKFFTTFNLTDDANRVQDILTSLRYLQQQGRGPIQLYGFGKAALWTLFAAATAEVPVHLHADLAGFHGSDKEFLDQFNVPGIQRGGGLDAALRLTRDER
jgi:dienelactone hydrolase